ncbi:TRAP transporter small permease [Jiella sp. M17.18]|uniref:TRAP transporter small permease n=1 Tax=Jiella sp. M17.18 TaxID=3234247 RepID=UPI0034DFE41F
MLALLWRLYNFILIGCLVLAGTLIAAAIALVVVDVSIRALGFRPFDFTVAFVEYILLYFVLLAAPYLVREKGHVCAEVVFSRLRGTPRYVCEKFVYILCIVVSLVFAWTGGVLFVEAIQYGYVDERSVDVPYWALYLFYPLSFTLIAIEFARYLIGVDSMYARHEPMESM